MDALICGGSGLAKRVAEEKEEEKYGSATDDIGLIIEDDVVPEHLIVGLREEVRATVMSCHNELLLHLDGWLARQEKMVESLLGWHDHERSLVPHIARKSENSNEAALGPIGSENTMISHGSEKAIENQRLLVKKLHRDDKGGLSSSSLSSLIPSVKHVDSVLSPDKSGFKFTTVLPGASKDREPKDRDPRGVSKEPRSSNESQESRKTPIAASGPLGVQDPSIPFSVRISLQNQESTILEETSAYSVDLSDSENKEMSSPKHSPKKSGESAPTPAPSLQSRRAMSTDTPKSALSTQQGSIIGKGTSAGSTVAFASLSASECLDEREEDSEHDDLYKIKIRDEMGILKGHSNTSLPLSHSRSRNGSDAPARKVSHRFEDSERTRQVNAWKRSLAHRKRSLSKSFIEARPTHWFRRRIRTIVGSASFSLAVGILIISNTMFIGVQVEFGRNIEDHIFWSVELLYCLAFFTEIVLRVYAEGKFFIRRRDWTWNIFDSLIVAFGTLEFVILTVIAWEGGSAGEATNHSLKNLSMLRLLRVARILKLMRIIRLIRLFRSFRILLYSVFNTLKSLVWALLLLCIIIYAFSIVFTQAATDPVLKSRLDSDMVLRLDEFYGTIPRSCYCLFQAFSGGLDWGEAAKPLGKIGAVYSLLFIAFISFVCFAVMNVITGTFCQNAIESAQKDHDIVIQEHVAARSMYKDQLESLFQDMDFMKTGSLTLCDFEEALKNRSIQDFFQSLEIDITDAWTIFKLLDQQGSQEVDLEEFVVGCLRLRGAATSVDLAKLMYDVDWLIKNLGAYFEYTEQEFRAIRSIFVLNSDVGGASASSMASSRRPAFGKPGRDSHQDPFNDMMSNVSISSWGGASVCESMGRKTSSHNPMFGNSSHNAFFASESEFSPFATYSSRATHGTQSTTVGGTSLLQASPSRCGPIQMPRSMSSSIALPHASSGMLQVPASTSDATQIKSSISGSRQVPRFTTTSASAALRAQQVQCNAVSKALPVPKSLTHTPQISNWRAAFKFT